MNPAIDILPSKTNRVPTMRFAAFLVAGALAMTISQARAADSENPQHALDFTMQTIDGESKDLEQYKGKVVLVVNVASKCGLTPQYTGLEKMYDQYKDRGFVILGFPCNQFRGQEPGTDAEIKEFCTTKYDVSFPLFSKVEVNGPDAAPLYKYLTSKDVGPAEKGDITWNFEKFLVGRDGKLIARFSPRTTPEDPELVKAVEAAL